MKYCNNCGQKLEDSMEFCVFCGAKQTLVQEMNSEPKAVNEYIEPQKMVENNEPGSKKSGNKVLIIVLIVLGTLLVTLLIAISLLVVKSIKDSTEYSQKLESLEREREEDDREEKDKKEEDKEDKEEDKKEEDKQEATKERETADVRPATEEPTAPVAEPTWNPEEPSVKSEFVLPNSDRVYLTKNDLVGLTAEQCRIARNEIYARRGRMFTDEGLQNYFNNCSWYVPKIKAEDFVDTMLNEYEIANRDLIVEYEKEMGYR